MYVVYLCFCAYRERHERKKIQPLTTCFIHDLFYNKTKPEVLGEDQRKKKRKKLPVHDWAGSVPCGPSQFAIIAASGQYKKYGPIPVALAGQRALINR